MKKIIGFIAIIVIITIAYNIINSGSTQTESVEDIASYKTQIQGIRNDKDQYLKTDKESPIENKNAFQQLPYFAIDPTWRVTATIDKLKSGQKIEIQMTGGETEAYEPYGNATFEIGGKKYALKLFINAEGLLFLPFKDLTSGKETYGAGRYLDLDPQNIKGSQLVIDFNLAYHPYCTYNHTFTCPIPPAENFLPIAIKAGERL
jgi:uncharacterized protein (DUF1684 family)